VATGFLGAPYRFGGSSLKGIDCSSFVQKIYRIFDITLPRNARQQSKVGISISREQLTEGDLVFFHTKRSLGHVGIYIGNNEFVHASSKRKVVRIDSLDTPYYQKRFQRAVRIKGLDNNGGGTGA
jgi:cell wall-associated NlpC family hydrolase